ncbi:nitrate ABC transporter permease [Zafaria cholistanensis]|uniref:Nitrate ABC transporter permease n=1 Tax=Zafaria cholistanensis TaxID=1682741 RepID=A0A5A7NPD2_9MICC|nr:ABC transporter permease [Zafaria cholistanensis]GER22764.1 nitrate ABC transporter permease [Zafaria cholistanensis]
MNRALPLLRTAALRLWLPVLLAIVWWYASAGSQNIYFPPLSTILETFAADWLGSRAATDLVPSLGKFVLGFLISAAGGIALGTWLGLSPAAREAAEPVVQFLRSLPPPVLLPIGLLLFGITGTMNVAIIVMGAIWPTVLNTADGIRSLDGQVADMSRSYRLTFAQRLFSVALPNAAPQVFAGLRTTLQLSIILIVVSEMVAAASGVGYYVLNSQQTFAVAQTWAGTLVLGLIGYLSTLVFLAVEKRVLNWQHGMRRAAEGA